MELDYRKLGLKVGLEIHQQLDTKRKLFCNCPTVLRDDDPHGEIRRFLRISQSEMGDIDRAALLEWKKGRCYIYQYYNDTTCLVELDEEPPHLPSQEALEVALQVALLMDMDVVDEIHTMRKIVIDGSNTSGFQRTMFIGKDGYVETEYGRVRISSLCLEEDASRKIEEGRDYIKYRVDRLGIPLLEISTEPDIDSPKMGRETAERIGMILRATGKVKRGLGTIRQDINISIRDGARVEIKGVQDLDLVEKVIKREVVRQINLLEISKILRERGAEVVDNIVDITEVLRDTGCNVLQNVLKRGGRIKGIVLKNFGGLVGREIQEGRRLGSELADRAKVIAGVGGLFHTDELPNYGITEEEIERVRRYIQEKLEIEITPDDVIVFIGGDRERVDRALEAVIERAKEAINGVPEETRRALEDGNTTYLRPLPGAARMYPETDIPPIKIDEKFLENIKNSLPEMPEEKLERFIREYKLNRELAEILITSPRVQLFERLCEMYRGSIKPTLIATTLENTLREIKREGYNIDNITMDHFVMLFDGLIEGRMSKEAIVEVLKGFAQYPDRSLDEILEMKGLRSLSKEEAERIIEDIVDKNIDVVRSKGMGSMGILMGRCMSVLRGRIDGKTVSEIVRSKIMERLRQKS